MSEAVENTDPVSVQDLESYWMPFTHNRYFKKHPTLVTGAHGIYYTMQDARRVLDGLSGLWCCNAGHGHPRIVDAVRRQVSELDRAR